jgi:hypothetical protein
MFKGVILDPEILAPDGFMAAAISPGAPPLLPTCGFMTSWIRRSCA